MKDYDKYTLNTESLNWLENMKKTQKRQEAEKKLNERMAQQNNIKVKK